MSSQVILFDLPSREPNKTWSLNPWKTRMLLNYKQIPYETQWIEYPDIKPTLEPHVRANEQGYAYTIPTVKFPDGTYLQDSRKIVDRIERDYPDRPVDANSQTLHEVGTIMSKLMPALGPEFVPKVPKRLLNPQSQEYWYPDRERRFGMPLDQLEQEKGGDAAYLAAKPHLEAITEILQRNREAGPFFEGNRVTYVDFVWAGFLRFFERIGEDVYGKMLDATGDPDVHRAQQRACAPWLERESY